MVYLCFLFNIAMSQSYFQVYLHVVFHVKSRYVQIDELDRPKLHMFMVEAFKKHHCYSKIINGVGDHVHCLLGIGRTSKDLSSIIGEVKRRSSLFLKGLSSRYRMFYWQGGYAAFSLAHKDCPAVYNYIATQDEHHRRVSSLSEMMRLCEKNGLSFDAEQFLNE